MDIKQHIMDLTQKVADGHASPLAAYIELHGISQVLGECLTMVKRLSFDEAQDRKGEVYMGKMIGYSEGRKTFKYDHIPQVAQIEKALTMMKEAHKDAALQQEKGRQTFDPETGEVIEPAVIVRGEATITLTEPKKK